LASIEEIFFLPPMAVARLGGSDIPLASFTWVEDPTLHGAGLTVISPAITLEVLSDGSVRPLLPASIQFRDGRLLRPVAPFFELWLRSNGREQAVTLKWLQDNGGSLASVQYDMTAANRKAARRTGDPACAYSTSIQVGGGDHTQHALLAFSSGDEPLVLTTTPIPLGHFQVIRPTPITAMGVDLSVLRVRFTPARGQVYGPPSVTRGADPDNGREHEIVPATNRILNPKASWVHYTTDGRSDSPEPSDTYDGSDDSNRRNRSFGVVDDTCDLILRASLNLRGRVWTATARAFAAPPDFAPDRRPFCSLAEELVDRDPPVETQEDLPDAMERLGDLFQRVYETASLANVDMMRNTMMPREDRALINFSGLPAVTRGASMTPRDTGYFDPDQDIGSPPSSHEKLPFSSVAEQIHGPLADTDELADFLREQAPLVHRLIRPAYAHLKDLKANVDANQKPDPKQRDPRIFRDTLHDMRMPPYMRDSDATPLSLNRRQYEFLLGTMERLGPKAVKAGRVPALFTRAQGHVARVVKRLSRTNPDPQAPTLKQQAKKAQARRNRGK
jgi:hypothetical protein